MDQQLIQKINNFAILPFRAAQSIIIDLAKQLTQNNEDIFYHISITLPNLTEWALDQSILTNIYRDIVVGSDTVDRETHERLVASLTASHDTITLMLQKEKEEREKEIYGLSNIISIL